MIFNSIRWRVQLWHGLILLVVLIGFGATAYQVVRDNLLRQVDQDLGQIATRVFFRPPGPPGGPPPGMESPDGPPPDGPGDSKGPPWGGHPDRPRPDRRELFEGPGGKSFGGPRFLQSLEQVWAEQSSETNGFYYLLVEGDGKILANSSNAPSSSVSSPLPTASQTSPPSPQGPGEPRPPSFRTQGHFREAIFALPFGSKLLIGRSMAPELAAMRHVALGLFAAGASVLALGLAGGWWLASRAIQPVEAISATALKIAGGDLSQRIDSADAVSELARLAAVLNSTFARLEASFAHQARFTSDASHELRTPVAVILSQTQTTLSRERAPGEYRQALEACQRAAQRMRKLTESLLQLARLDAGQEPIKREAFDLSRVCRECLELVRPLAQDRGVELNSELPETNCLGDPERIAQVVTNLLTNAIQFNRPAGKVRLSAAAQNHSALLKVEDTGEGIPVEDLSHIFERFYRVEKSRSGSSGRSGLGLAISKAIVDAHSGSIEVSSQVGSGSTFTVKLPAA